MKGVTDIFISKEKLAVFWFMVACGCLAGMAWYLYDAALTSRGNMLYVPVEKSFVYLDRTLDQQELNQLVDFHARLATETFLNRGPKGFLTPERIQYLFVDKGLEQALQDERDTLFDADKFKIHQLMEVGEVQLQHFPDGTARTIVNGQLIRVSRDPITKETLTYPLQVVADMTWVRNPSLRDSRRFPYVCNEVAYDLKVFASAASEEDTKEPNR
ncbi:MAG TPA: hypothetical protein VGE39_14685 [Prosthecobacter sp.]